jgi:hypothetical protein
VCVRAKLTCPMHHVIICDTAPASMHLAVFVGAPRCTLHALTTFLGPPPEPPLSLFSLSPLVHVSSSVVPRPTPAHPHPLPLPLTHACPVTFRGLAFAAFPKTPALNFAPNVSFTVTLYLRAATYTSGSIIAADKGFGAFAPPYVLIFGVGQLPPE